MTSGPPMLDLDRAQASATGPIGRAAADEPVGEPERQRGTLEFAYPLTGCGRLQLYGELEHTPGHRIGGIHKAYDAHTGAMVAAFLPRIVRSPEVGAKPAATAP